MERHAQTKGERRESKRRKRRKMGVSGSSVRRLQEVILKKSRNASSRRK